MWSCVVAPLSLQSQSQIQEWSWPPVKWPLYLRLRKTAAMFFFMVGVGYICMYCYIVPCGTHVFSLSEDEQKYDESYWQEDGC